MVKKFFDKLRTNFDLDTPLVSGDNVFSTQEFADNFGTASRTARERLQTLAKDGKVRKVRTRRAGRILLAWEYLGK